MTKASLIATLLVSTLVTACAAETSETGSESSTASESSPESPAPAIGQTQQGLCPVGRICTRIPTGGLTIYDPPTTVATDDPPTFTCSTRRNFCDPYLTYDASTQSYVCVWGCGGGGFGYARYNPCPSWAPNYVCTPYGSCSCY